MLGKFTLGTTPLGTLPLEGAAGSLSPTLYTNTATFGSHRVDLALTATAYANTSTFGAASLSLNIEASLYANTTTFGTPELDFVLSATLYVDADTFGTPTLTLYLQPSHFADGDTLYPPSVIHVITPGRYVNTSTFGGTDYLDLEILASLYTNEPTFGAAVLAVPLSVELLEGLSIFYPVRVGKVLGVNSQITTSPSDLTSITAAFAGASNTITASPTAQTNITTTRSIGNSITSSPDFRVIN